MKSDKQDATAGATPTKNTSTSPSVFVMRPLKILYNALWSLKTC